MKLTNKEKKELKELLWLTNSENDNQCFGIKDLKRLAELERKMGDD